jgi:TonB family protein
MGLILYNYLRAEFRKSNPARLASATLALALCLTAAFVPASLAQKKTDRKVIVVSTPDYPDILRHAQVGGTVRLKATVLPNGTVTNVEIVGGNPILAENAVTAVKKWKYAPADKQTVEDVALRFTPH